MKQVVNGFRIAAIAATPGSEIRRMADETPLYGGDEEQLARIRRALGLDTRRIAAPGVTTLDLCEVAARRVLSGRELTTIDALIFVTQTPDTSQPCNAARLHGRLGLAKHCAAWDVALGCSGYVYALSQAAAVFATSDARSVLVCAGDTLSRVVHPRDRATAPLFGDAGSATLLVRDATAPAVRFALFTDGAGAESLCVPAGGYRVPSSASTRVEHRDAEGNWRTDEHLRMDGAEVFNFTLREVPPAVRELMADRAWAESDVDALVLHQANRFVVSQIGRSLRFPLAKVPADICGEFGNQSSASIPFALCHALGGSLTASDQAPLNLILAGFGVGLSWGVAAMTAGGLDCAEIVEYRR